MIHLTDADLSTLFNMRIQARASSIGYWQIYQWLGDKLITNYGVSTTDSAVLWLRGATEANAGRGAFSELIRSYTDAQYQLRYGKAMPAGTMQEASVGWASAHHLCISRYRRRQARRHRLQPRRALSHRV